MVSVRAARPEDGLRARVSRLASAGQTSFDDLGVFLYRYGARTSTSRGTRGGGLCLLLQGHKELRVATHVLRAESGQMIVVTRGADLQVVADVAGTGRPYLALGVWFDPERVARALLRLAELEAPAVTAEHAAERLAFTGGRHRGRARAAARRHRGPDRPHHHRAADPRRAHVPAAPHGRGRRGARGDGAAAGRGPHPRGHAVHFASTTPAS